MKFVLFCCLLFSSLIWARLPLTDDEISAIRQKCLEKFHITKADLKKMKFDDPEDFLALNYTHCKVVNYGYFNPRLGLDCQRIAEQVHYEPTTTKQVFDAIKNCCLDRNPHRVSAKLWATRMYNCVLETDLYRKCIRDKNAYANMVKREHEIHEYVLKLRKEYDEQEKEREARLQRQREARLQRQREARLQRQREKELEKKREKERKRQRQSHRRIKNKTTVATTTKATTTKATTTVATTTKATTNKATTTKATTTVATTTVATTPVATILTTTLKTQNHTL